MASGPITSWEINGETVETVSDFIFLGSKITANGDCSHEIKRRVSLDGKEIQPVHPKGDQSWMFFGRTDAKSETPILWPPDAMCWLIGKDSDAGRDWGQEEKGTTEDEMAGWHHQLDGHEWVISGSWWWTGRPGMLQFMGSQRVGHDWATELTDWTDYTFNLCELTVWGIGHFGCDG